MEFIAKVKEVCAFNQRNFTDSQGEEKMFKSLGFILQIGKHSVYAEAVMEYAELLSKSQADNPLTGKCCWVKISTKLDDFTDKNGNRRYGTTLRLDEITPMW